MDGEQVDEQAGEQLDEGVERGDERPVAGDQATATAGQEPGPSAQDGGEHAAPPLPDARDSEVEQLKADLAVERRKSMESHRRALLAENAGRVVPELVTGDTVEELEASVERARAAFESVRAAALAEMAAAAVVGAGNGQRGQAVDVEQLSPMQKIAYGLKRSNE